MATINIFPNAVNHATLTQWAAWYRVCSVNTHWVPIDSCGPLMVIGNTVAGLQDSSAGFPDWAVTKIALSQDHYTALRLKLTQLPAINEEDYTCPTSVISELPRFPKIEDAARFVIEQCPVEKTIAEMTQRCIATGARDYPAPVLFAAKVLMAGLRFVSLSVLSIDDTVRSLIPADLSSSHGAIAFHKDEEGIHLAVKEFPFSVLVDKLRSRTSIAKVVPYLAPGNSIDEAIVARGRVPAHNQRRNLDADEGARAVSMEITERAMVSDIAATRDGELLLGHILGHAIQMRASDIHIQPENSNTTLVRFRIDRDAQTYCTLNPVQSELLFGRIRMASDMKEGLHLFMDDASMIVRFNGQDYDLRLSNIPVKGGYRAPQSTPCVTIRLLAKSNKFKTLNDIGLRDRDRSIIRAAIKQPEGMILVSGRTSSGKSTTVFAMLSELKSEANVIMSIEDPVEYSQTLVKQTQVDADNGITPETFIPKSLRANPNILYAGETRDEPIARAGIAATSSGHLYFSTIHANSATAAISRLTGVFNIPALMVSDYLQMVIHQALVRTPCSKTSMEYPLVQHPQEQLIRQYFKAHFPNHPGLICDDTMFRYVDPGAGQYGFQGETMVAEVLPVTRGLRELIERGASERELREHAIKHDHFFTIHQDALIKVLRGIISIDEMVRLGNPNWIPDLDLGQYWQRLA